MTQQLILDVIFAFSAPASGNRDVSFKVVAPRLPNQELLQKFRQNGPVPEVGKSDCACTLRLTVDDRYILTLTETDVLGSRPSIIRAEPALLRALAENPLQFLYFCEMLRMLSQIAYSITGPRRHSKISWDLVGSNAYKLHGLTSEVTVQLNRGVTDIYTDDGNRYPATRMNPGTETVALFRLLTENYATNRMIPLFLRAVPSAYTISIVTAPAA